MKTNIFNGRINRTDFLISILLNGISMVGIGWLIVLVYSKTSSSIYLGANPVIYILIAILSIVGIFTQVLFISLVIRRLHDINMSGWRILLGFIPFVNIILSLYLFIASGTKGENLYGIDRSNDPLLNVILNRHTQVSSQSGINVSKKRQVVAIILIILYLVTLFVFIYE